MSSNIPSIFIILGATGDLMSKKIVPALYHLFEKEKLPKLIRIIGFSRQDFNDESFRNQILKFLSEHKDIKASSEKLKEFLKLFSYHPGTFENNSDYKSLAEKLGQIDGEWKVCANKLFYLAVPPVHYEVIFRQLAESGLTKPCSEEEGWTRVLVEKPFGKDLATSIRLDEQMAKLFKEEQIYRIDHYLAKEMVQNILSFRFANNLFDESWNRHFIAKIYISLNEKIGVENRGAFYDGLGALRDVGQNHLLQMLSLITMENPLTLSARSIRAARAKILATLSPISGGEVKRATYRSQYLGFRDISGVETNSNTETYFKAKIFLEADRWRDVPIIIESGKRLNGLKKEVAVYFRHPSPCLCSPDQPHLSNKVIFGLEPFEGIKIDFVSKKPGLEYQLKMQQFEFMLREKKGEGQYVEEYEKLLLDCIFGDQTLFVSTDEVKAMWRLIDPVVSAWEKDQVPLRTYSADTDEAQKDSLYIEESLGQTEFKKEIGIVGLGKMGGNMARRLSRLGFGVVGYNRSPEATVDLEKDGVIGAFSLKELVEKLKPPRIVWLMLPHQNIDEVLFGEGGLAQILEEGDYIVDGGNTYFEETVRRYQKIEDRNLNFIDVGISGGPGGALNGACLMIGGKKKIFTYLEPLFFSLAVRDGYQFFPGKGAGHFVKMVHNGIEYGMMQAIAEGFSLLKIADFKLDLTRAADVYNHGSVIESRLIGWLKEAFIKHSEGLDDISGVVEHTGEGEWTVKFAEKVNVKVSVINDAFNFRIDSKENPDYTGKILSALREQFGGHKVTL